MSTSRSAAPAIDLFPDHTPDVFAGINVRSPSQVRIVVPPNAVVDGAITITHTIPADGSLVCPRLVVEAGENSEVTIVERFVSAADGPALALPVLQVAVGQAARVNYLAVNELSEQAWSLGNQQAVGQRDSQTLLATVALGGDYARVRTDARVSGRGASTRQVALYFAGGSQMHDFRTIQDHDAPNTTSDLLFKGAVQDHAASVYTGLIKIREHANGTVAFQTNRNLTLSRGCVGGERPEPGHPDERRQVLPRVDRRPDRRGPAVLPRESGRATGDRRAARGARLLRRGAHAAARTRARRRAPSPCRRQAEHRCNRRGGLSMMTATTTLCAFDDIAPGTARKFDVGGVAIAVVRIDDDVYAIGDVCSHANVSLVGGRGVVRRAGDRVPEARQHVQPAPRANHRPCRRPSRSPCTTHR